MAATLARMGRPLLVLVFLLLFERAPPILGSLSDSGSNLDIFTNKTRLIKVASTTRMVHDQCPTVCSCLGSMVDCSEKGLTRVPPDLPSWLVMLDLQTNGILELREDDFKGLDNLEKLDISSNKISLIDEAVFAHLPNLKELDISGNKISAINETVFSRLPNLKELKLNHNQLNKMPYFGKNYSLVELHLQHNWIQTIESRVLNGLPKLRILDMNFNQIYHITTGTFHAGLSIQQLFLNNNKVKLLETHCLDNLTSLEWLKLNKNKLSHLPKPLFEKLSQLKHLEMSRNKLSIIESLSFLGLDNLQVLKLKRNSITTLKDGSFFGLKKIQNLQLDHNNISAISKGWLYGLENLGQLSLTHNNIKSIELDNWEFCSKLWELDLSYNQLTAISAHSFARLYSLQCLYLDHNHIADIHPKAFKDLSSLETLQLNHNEISWVVEDMDGAFSGLDRLVRLGLNGNRFKSVAKQAFKGLHNLKYLSMLDNSIASILENAFKPLQFLQDLKFNSSNLLCDCQLAWFPKWLSHKDFRSSVTAVCAHPQSSKGKNIFAVRPEDFACTDFPKPVITSQPMSQKALKGENLTLNCSAVSSGFFDTKFQWKKDSMILTDPKMDNFTSVEGKLIRLTSLLHLENVQDETAGKYQCIISNHFGSAYSQKANITVRVYPSFTKKPEDVTVKSGSTARLECAAWGQPQPQISWQKDGGNDFPAARERRMHVMPTDDVFFIVDVKSSDEGTYSCTATNEAGTAATNATLKVLETPSFTRAMVSEKYVRHGETTVLECMASGSPKPKLTWIKDNLIVKPSRRHYFTASDQLLVIVDTIATDTGIYTCELTNTLGTERGTTKLMMVPSPGGDPESYSSSGLDNSSTTTGIIIIAVVCCVVGTSLVWVIIIYQTRKRPEEYSATPTDETTLPDVASSGYNSSDKEGSYSQTRLTVSGYQYQYPGASNSISSLHCPNSESDTLKSSRSTSSTHTGGNSAEHSADHSTLQTFHQQATCQDSLMDSECPPDTIERIHRFPNLQGTPPPPPTLRRAYLRVDPNSTAGDRYHGSQPPGTWDTDTDEDLASQQQQQLLHHFHHHHHHHHPQQQFHHPVLCDSNATSGPTHVLAGSSPSPGSTQASQLPCSQPPAYSSLAMPPPSQHTDTCPPYSTVTARVHCKSPSSIYINNRPCSSPLPSCNDLSVNNNNNTTPINPNCNPADRPSYETVLTAHPQNQSQPPSFCPSCPSPVSTTTSSLPTTQLPPQSPSSSSPSSSSSSSSSSSPSSVPADQRATLTHPSPSPSPVIAFHTTPHYPSKFTEPPSTHQHKKKFQQT